MNEALKQSIVRGKELGKLALYFGCWGKQKGHYLFDTQGRSLYDSERYKISQYIRPKPKDLPWNHSLMDTGLLKNGKVPDMPTGKVFWTCGGDKAFWYAFYWWDRSVDSRPNSNSGFYVRGFGWPDPQEAFDYARGQFPSVVSRQLAFPLVLQNVERPKEDAGGIGFLTPLNIVDDRNDDPDYAAWKDVVRLDVCSTNTGGKHRYERDCTNQSQGRCSCGEWE